MYTCKDARIRLDDYLDQELCRDEADGVRRHLAVCNACRERFRFEEHVWVTIRAKCRATEPPRGLWRRIEQQLAGA